jgi:hypothetical protein
MSQDDYKFNIPPNDSLTTAADAHQMYPFTTFREALNEFPATAQAPSPHEKYPFTTFHEALNKFPSTAQAPSPHEKYPFTKFHEALNKFPSTAQAPSPHEKYPFTKFHEALNEYGEHRFRQGDNVQIMNKDGVITQKGIIQSIDGFNRATFPPLPKYKVIIEDGTITTITQDKLSADLGGGKNRIISKKHRTSKHRTLKHRKSKHRKSKHRKSKHRKSKHRKSIK